MPIDDHAVAVLALVADLMGVLDRDEFGVALVTALRAAVPSDWVSLNGVGPRPQDVWVVADPPLPLEFMEPWGRHAHQNPLIIRYQQTLDGRAYRFSDVIDAATLHELEVYRDVYAHVGVEHQIAFTLPGERDQLLGVALSRSECDYTDEERDLLNAMRPFLIQAFRNVVAFSGRPGVRPDPVADAGLTTREADVLRLVVAGRRDQAVADALGLSVRTVEKHLQRVYRKLGVQSRTEAVLKALGSA